jgi:hypothetical protein
MFSIIAGMLIFFTYIPVTIDVVCPKLNKKYVKIMAMVVFFMTAIVAIITGSRFAIILPVVYFIILMLYARKISFKIRIKNILILLAIVSIVGYVVGGLFLSRMALLGQDGAERVSDKMGYTRKVPFGKSYTTLMKKYEDSFLYTYLFSYSNIVQYEAHAVYEFPEFMNYIDERGDFFYGQATFWVYAKLVYKVIGSDYDLLQDLMSHNSTPGLWGTFFFQWYLDWGWFGVFMMFFMGIISKQIWRSVYENCQILTLPLLIFTSMIWLMVLNLNQISTQGAYAIFSFVTLIMFFGKKVIPPKEYKYSFDTVKTGAIIKLIFRIVR